MYFNTFLFLNSFLFLSSLQITQLPLSNSFLFLSSLQHQNPNTRFSFLNSITFQFFLKKNSITTSKDILFMSTIGGEFLELNQQPKMAKERAASSWNIEAWKKKWRQSSPRNYSSPKFQKDLRTISPLTTEPLVSPHTAKKSRTMRSVLAISFTCAGLSSSKNMENGSLVHVLSPAITIDCEFSQHFVGNFCWRYSPGRKKRPFHVHNGDGFETPNQQPERINMFRTAVGGDTIFAFLEPLIRKVIREETECAISKLFPSSSSSDSEAETSTAGYSLQLLFDDKLPDRIFTNNPLKAEGGGPLKIYLCYANSKTIVESGPLSSAKVDFVVINGLFSRDREDWTQEEFNSQILSERDGKRPLLAGPQSIVLKNGVGIISDLSITDNSSWIPNRKFILGAKISPKIPGEHRVKPARSYPFSVKDSRGEGYTKHHPPSLQDEVWRLVKIRKNGKFHELLTLYKILTVKDFLVLNETNQPMLRRILDRMSDKVWRKVLDHAKTCIVDNCTIPRYPNGCDGALVEVLNQSIFPNRFDEQPTPKLPLTYQLADPSISPNLGLHPLEPGIMLPQEDLRIRAPNTNNSDEDRTTLILQNHNNHTSRVFPPTLEPADYVVEECTLLPQTPIYYPPATLGHGNELLPFPSYAAATAGGWGILPCLDHGSDILNGAD